MVAADWSGDLSVLVDPRLLTEDDIPWMYHLGKKRYSVKYDAVTVEGWIRNLVLKQPLMFLPQRTDHAFCISMLAVTPWFPADFECNIVLLCADENHMWEAMKLMRASIEWGRSRQCKVWRMNSDTEMDFGPLARRVGADEISPRFALRY